MHEHSDAYLQSCLNQKLLTAEPIRKYPLRSANLAMVLKVYAIYNKLPYTLDNRNFSIFDSYKYYLTDEGLDWVFNVFSNYSLEYLRSTFQYLFVTIKDLKNFKNHYNFSNLRGTLGEQPKAGTKQKAVLVRTNGKFKKEYHFDTVRDARKEILNLSRFYPIEQFTLYSMHKDTYKGATTYFRRQIPVLLEENRRGTAINLPHLRGENK